jgi:hypothetical protein
MTYCYVSLLIGANIRQCQRSELGTSVYLLIISMPPRGRKLVAPSTNPIVGERRIVDGDYKLYLSRYLRRGLLPPNPQALLCAASVGYRSNSSGPTQTQNGQHHEGAARYGLRIDRVLGLQGREQSN